MNAFDAKRAAIIWMGLRFSPLIDRALSRWSELNDQPVIDPGLFDWVPELEQNWMAIRNEADQILGDKSALPPLRLISPDHCQIATDDRWKSFVLWGYGLRSEENCARCPETARLLERVPGLLTALFSVLDPHSHIPRHTGPTKAIVTGHLGLRIPRQPERCHMEIADTDYVWQEGRIILFDDMYEHEVWNDTDERRVVLMVHIKRPERFPGSLVRDAFLAAARHSPFIQDARRNIENWRRSVANGYNGY
jgi:beta-hydroxylase